jgi:hypothetical protein
MVLMIRLRVRYRINRDLRTSRDPWSFARLMGFTPGEASIENTSVSISLRPHGSFHRMRGNDITE